MSRGAGRIERAIRELFNAHPDAAYVTSELVKHCYPDVTEIERKHEVSVLRAARKIVRGDRDWQVWNIDYGQGGGCVFLNHGNLKSYTKGRDLCADYVSPKRAARAAHPYRRMTARKPPVIVLPPTSEHILARDRERAERYRIEREASFTRAVQLHCARRDGFTTWADALQGRLNAEAASGPMCFHSDAGVGMATHNPDLPEPEKTVAADDRFLATIAERLRGLTTQNDPDVLRDCLAAIAAEVDARRGVVP